MVDRVRFLKIEEPPYDDDMGLPTEADPSEDYGVMAGIIFLDDDNIFIDGVSGVSGYLRFKDKDTNTIFTLRDLGKRLNRVNVSDTTPVNGQALIYDSSVSAWKPAIPGSVTNGVLPPFIFSKAGNAGTGTYLRTGEAITSNTGQIIKGSNTISQISVSNGSNVATTTRVQLQRRTGVNTFVDVASGFVDITSGTYSGTVSGLSVAWGPDWEMSAYVKSGSTLDNPVLVVYLLPA